MITYLLLFSSSSLFPPPLLLPNPPSVGTAKRKRKSKRKTEASEVIRQQLQFLDENVSESGKSTDIESDSDRKAKKSRKSRRKTTNVNYEEYDDEVESDVGSKSAKTQRTKTVRKGDSEVEEDWLELRSRKVLQASGEELEESDAGSGKLAKVRSGKKSRSKTVRKADSEMEEDWLELRSRKVLQASGEELEENDDENESDAGSGQIDQGQSAKVRRKRTSKKVGSEAEEDWLELRSRKVLQASGEELEEPENDNVVPKEQSSKRMESSTSDIRTEDFGETLEKEDWLILRNRKVLQETGSDDEAENISESPKKGKSRSKRKSRKGRVTKAKGVALEEEDVEGVDEEEEDGEEDWLELRSRKVLQSDGQISGVEQVQELKTPRRKRKIWVQEPLFTSSSEDDEDGHRLLSAKGKGRKSLQAKTAKDNGHGVSTLIQSSLESETGQPDVPVVMLEKMQDIEGHQSLVDGEPEKERRHSKRGKESLVQSATEKSKSKGDSGEEEDWLELRNRNILQGATIPDELEEVEEAEENLTPAEPTSKGVIGEASISENSERQSRRVETLDSSPVDTSQSQGDANSEEDWLELRNRNVLQSIIDKSEDDSANKSVLLRQEETAMVKKISSEGSSDGERRQSKRGKKTVVSTENVPESLTEEHLAEDLLELRNRNILQSTTDETGDARLEEAAAIEKTMDEGHSSSDSERRQSKRGKKTSVSTENVSSTEGNPEEDWLELRSRSVLQSVTIAEEQNLDQANKAANQPDPSRALTAAVNDGIDYEIQNSSGSERRTSKRGKKVEETSPSADEGVLEEDWLELRNRNVLQSVTLINEQGEGSAVNDNNQPAPTKQLEAMGESPDAMTIETEQTPDSDDFLELRNRNVLQSSTSTVPLEQAHTEVLSNDPLPEQRGHNEIITEDRQAKRQSKRGKIDDTLTVGTEGTSKTEEDEQRKNVSGPELEEVVPAEKSVTDQPAELDILQSDSVSGSNDVEMIVLDDEENMTSSQSGATENQEVDKDVLELRSRVVMQFDDSGKSSRSNSKRGKKSEHSPLTLTGSDAVLQDSKTEDEDEDILELRSRNILQSDSGPSSKSNSRRGKAMEYGSLTVFGSGTNSGDTTGDQVEEIIEEAWQKGLDSLKAGEADELNLFKNTIAEADTTTASNQMSSSPAETLDVSSKGNILVTLDVEDGLEETSLKENDQEDKVMEEDIEHEDKSEDSEPEESLTSEDLIETGNVSEQIEDDNNVEMHHVVGDVVVDDGDEESVKDADQEDNLQTSEDEESENEENEDEECDKEETNAREINQNQGFDTFLSFQAKGDVVEMANSSMYVETDINDDAVKRQLLTELDDVEPDFTMDSVENSVENTTSMNMTGDLSTSEYVEVHLILKAWQQACEQAGEMTVTQTWADGDVEKFAVDVGDIRFCVASKYFCGPLEHLFDQTMKLQTDILSLQVESWTPCISEEDVNGVLNKFGVRVFVNHDKQTNAATLTCFRNDTFPIVRTKSCTINAAGSDGEKAQAILQISAFQRAKGNAFCLGNLFLPKQQDSAPSQDIQTFLISTSFQHLFDAAGGAYNPVILCAHLKNLDTSSSEYNEILQGYFNPDISFQHSTLLPTSVSKKLLGTENSDQDFIWYSEESVRLHKMVNSLHGEPLQVMFSLGKGLFAHQTRVITASNSLAMIESEVCPLDGRSLSSSPTQIQLGLLPQKIAEDPKMDFQLNDHNRHWPWI